MNEISPLEITASSLMKTPAGNPVDCAPRSLDAKRVNKPRVALLVTGRLGHRGVDPAALLARLSVVKSLWPELWIVLATSDRAFDPCSTMRKFAFDALVNCDVMDLSDFHPLQGSVALQCSQITQAIQSLPGSIEFAVRLRTDWLIDEPEVFISTLREKASSRSFGLVSYSSAKPPFFPAPFFFNDNFTFGPVPEMAKLWEGLDRSSIQSSEVAKVFSRSLFFFLGSLKQMPEQGLWARYFGVEPSKAFVFDVSWGRIKLSLEASESLDQVDFWDFGLRPPDHVLASTTSFAKTLYGPPKSLGGKLLRPLMIALAWTLANLFFWAHPAWIVSRVQFFLKPNQ